MNLLMIVVSLLAALSLVPGLVCVQGVPLTGTCVSIGYSTSCCPRQGANCQASDGNCGCGDNCHAFGDCCSDVHCPESNKHIRLQQYSEFHYC